MGTDAKSTEATDATEAADATGEAPEMPGRTGEGAPVEPAEPTAPTDPPAGKKKRRPVDPTKQRRRRLVKAELNRVLANKRCEHCGTLGAWEVYDVDRHGGRTRYVRCLGCQRCSQVPVIVARDGGE